MEDYPQLYSELESLFEKSVLCYNYQPSLLENPSILVMLKLGLEETDHVRVNSSCLLSKGIPPRLLILETLSADS